MRPAIACVHGGAKDERVLGFWTILEVSQYKYRHSLGIDPHSTLCFSFNKMTPKDNASFFTNRMLEDPKFQLHNIFYMCCYIELLSLQPLVITIILVN